MLSILSTNPATSKEVILNLIHKEPGVIYRLGFYKMPSNPNKLAVIAIICRRSIQ